MAVGYSVELPDCRHVIMIDCDKEVGHVFKLKACCNSSVKRNQFGDADQHHDFQGLKTTISGSKFHLRQTQYLEASD
jgi:hypothetical protein